ncbi:DUF4145 domain-containing protein [Sinorhizobium meliloti]|uniref:DUF4145 domain-containing protein n=2 Tax=Rhizobium meliloti TaxID=382 RepID=UPI000D1DC966|nr:DUF4145 domain-containing protein [Sinorhizobium meliloti]MDW9453483.1 DUF4145 domain-containing protein [Sinorhizobium meliloti]MDW9466122.1 DUF4145 domain-containing protein [Sinorhizobium meliloti]MDW9500432.1 DUF4145 domain-containing protein [Sinorhizobium meliloti]MDW9517269.1 DUF4145 domain-containing protein [Sinorhizobium meliloti]
MPDKIGDRVKGHCPSCGPDRWAIIRGCYTKHESDDHVWYSVDHRILQCPACDEVYHQTDSTFSEDFDIVEHPVTGDPEWIQLHKFEHWPPPAKRKRPDWLTRLPTIDTELYKLMDEFYSALEMQLSVLAAIGIRTTFDRGAELLGIDPGRTFRAKLDDLRDQGFIGETERDSLQLMTEAGNASAHRGWRPTDEQLETMLQLIESFIHRNFILRHDVSNLRGAIPARPQRRP